MKRAKAQAARNLVLFLYDAFNPQTSAAVSGSCWAPTQDSAEQRLRARGYTDLVINESGLAATSVSVSDHALALFFRQMAVMLRSGTALAKALDLGSFTEDRYLSGVVEALSDGVAGGKSLSVAMSHFPRVFSPLMVGLISAAEASGGLAETLGDIAESEERRVRLKNQLVSALAYPAFLTVSTLAMTALFVFYVLPMDQELFGSLGVPLPAITTLLIDAINFAKSPVGILLEVLVVGFAVAAMRSATARQRAKEKALEAVRYFRLPRTILDKAASASMLNVMGLLLRGGSSVDVALRFMLSASDDTRQKRLIAEVRSRILAGDELGDALQCNALFPSTVVALLVVGYESGSLEEMCAKAASICEDDVRVALDAATALVEPLLMGFAGLVGGFVIISSAMPLLKLVESL